MTIVEKFKQHISKLPEMATFTGAALRHLATPDTVRKTLGRLAKAGEIQRLGHGVYAKPKLSRKGVLSLPSTYKTLIAIAQTTGETLGIHGAEAARRLQLTTQMPLQAVFYTSGKSRNLNIRGRTIVLKHISPKKIVSPGTTTEIIISALWYLGRGQVTVKTIEHIASAITTKEFTTALKHMEQMPAWMANQFYLFESQQKAA